MKVLLTLLLLGPLVYAADAPKLSETSELRILAAYQKQYIAQASFQLAKKDEQMAQEIVNEMATAAESLCTKELKAAGFPDGTHCAPDINTGKVTTVAPPEPPKDAKQPEPKPPDKK